MGVSTLAYIIPPLADLLPHRKVLYSALKCLNEKLVDYTTSFLRQFFTTSGEKLAQVHEFAYVLFAIFSFRAIPKIIGYFMWM